MALNENEAQHALRLLAEVATQREEKLKTYGIDNAEVNSDDDADSKCPVLDSFLHAEACFAILRVATVFSREFQNIFGKFEGPKRSNWNIERGRKSAHTAKDLCFMIICALKHGCAWDISARLLRIKTSTFEKFISSFKTLLSELVSDEHVLQYGASFPFNDLLDQKESFSTLSYAQYSSDVFSNF